MATTIAEKIIASLPKKLSGPKAQAALVLIISALSGERVHFYDSWHVSGGWKTLRSADGADDAFRALRSAGVPVVTGNDAPRGPPELPRRCRSPRASGKGGPLK